MLSTTFILLLLSGATLVRGIWLPFRRRASICNGREELCDRLYSNVTVVGAHNSFAWSDVPVILSRNQEVNVSQQLQLGARLLQAQSHLNIFGDFRLCHTNCLLFDGGKVVDFLITVRKFLEANVNEVVTLIFTNPEGLSISERWLPAFEKSGLVPMIYVPPHLPLRYAEWPTLGEMISSGKRAVIFMDSKTNTSLVNWIMPQFQMIWETPFTVMNASFPCSVIRIHGPLPVEDHTYLINHSLHKRALPDVANDIIIPDTGQLAITNSLTSIIDNVGRCSPLGADRNPQFLLMDFINVGEGFEAADTLNGLTPRDPPKNGAATLDVCQWSIYLILVTVHMSIRFL